MVDPSAASHAATAADSAPAGFTWERSRSRWRSCTPDVDLTWGFEITGDAFVTKVNSYGAFGSEVAVVEIGPGYGRLLSSALRQGIEFGSWLGVDLSADNVEHLWKTFPQPQVYFRQDDVEKMVLDRPADCVISSLTFKHLYPSFDRALQNLSRQMAPEGVIAFDLIEGHNQIVEHDGVTFVRHYQRSEVSEMLARAALELVAFDQVIHAPEEPRTARLLVVARRRS